jgi:hypothetical protein
MPRPAHQIRQRLSDVFRQEIDPTMGDAAHQGRLQVIHLGLGCRKKSAIIEQPVDIRLAQHPSSR